MTLFQALCLFMLLPQGFRNADLRQHVAQLMGMTPLEYSAGKMTYDLRRLRLHGGITREVGTNSYHITHEGIRICLFITKVYHRVIRPGLSQVIEAVQKPQGDLLPVQ